MKAAVIFTEDVVSIEVERQPEQDVEVTVESSDSTVTLLLTAAQAAELEAKLGRSRQDLR